MKTTIPAVGYLRRSTDKQEASLSDQRKEIEKYAAAHGYQILRWYKDDGISGDATQDREDFKRMIGDAASREFQVILCWKSCRFGRFDLIDAGEWISPLRRAGVSLVTVMEGPIDWENTTGRLMYGIQQEAKHQFLKDLSQQVTRGMIGRASEGYLVGQAAPYGYDRMLTENGKPMQRVRNGQKFAKPREWRVTLVPSDDPRQVETVRWLFRTYADTDIGIRSLCDSLNKRGVPSPRGEQWYVGTVREILRSPVYRGVFTWGRRRIGKYHRAVAAAGEIKPRDTSERSGKGRPLVIVNPREERIVKENAHPALIDAETFDRVQVKLGARRARTSSHKKTNGDRYLLAGMVRCGHCGAKMHGSVTTVKKNGKVYQFAKYVCSTYQMKGRECGCGRHAVDQGDLLDMLLRKLQEAILAGGHRKALRERILEKLKARQASDPKRIAALRREVDQLDRELEQGTKRLLKAPDAIADLLAQELAAQRKQRDRLAAELADADDTHQPQDLEAEADRIADTVWELSQDLTDQCEPARLRELLRRMVAGIDLFFDHVPQGNKIRCPLSKGVIAFRNDPIFGLVSRGDWI